MASVVVVDSDPIPKNNRPVTFSFDGFTTDKLMGYVCNLQDNVRAVLCVHEFNEGEMLRTLEVVVSRDLGTFALQIEFQRTAFGVQLNPQFPNIFKNQDFLPVFNQELDSFENMDLERPNVRIRLDDSNFNRLVSVELEGAKKGTTRIIGNPANKPYTAHYLIFEFQITNDVKNTELFIKALFESIEKMVVLLQRTKLAIPKEVSRVTIPVISGMAKPLPPAILGH